MKEKKFPLPGEVLSENHQFRTSKPPIHGFSILARREKRNKKPPRGSKRQSLRIENSEPPDPLRHKFSILARRGKQEASKALQNNAVSENREF